jgi:hypothetical protein
VFEITRDLSKGRPTSIYKDPKQIEPLYPFTGRFSGRPDVPIELTGRVAPRPIALRHPRVLLNSTATARSSNATHRPDALHTTTGRAKLDQTRWSHNEPNALVKPEQRTTKQ